MRTGTASPAEAMEDVRIDRWLWAARFFKTRAAATDAVLGGHVELNGSRVKPSKGIRIGDSVEIRIGAARWAVDVTGLAEKRGPASVAATLYRETPKSVARRQEQTLQRRLAVPPPADVGGRPTKRDRRRLEALRRAWGRPPR